MNEPHTTLYKIHRIMHTASTRLAHLDENAFAADPDLVREAHTSAVALGHVAHDVNEDFRTRLGHTWETLIRSAEQMARTTAEECDTHTLYRFVQEDYPKWVAELKDMDLMDEADELAPRTWVLGIGDGEPPEDEKAQSNGP